MIDEAKLRVALAVMSGRKGELHLLTKEDLRVLGYDVDSRPVFFGSAMWRDVLKQCEDLVFAAVAGRWGIDG